MKRLVLLLLTLALLAIGCGSGDLTDLSDTGIDAGSPSSDDESDDGDFSGIGGGDFCDRARILDDSDPLADVSIFDGKEFFEVTTDFWDGLVEDAPPEIASDIDVITENLDDMQELLAANDYDLFDQEVITAMDALDTGEADAASARIERYVEDVCGIDIGSSDLDDVDIPDLSIPDLSIPDLEDLDLDDLDLEDFDIPNLDDDAFQDAIEDQDTAAVIAQVFGIDRELAECLERELGLTDPDNIDPSIMQQEVCGTTLLEVITGIGN